MLRLRKTAYMIQANVKYAIIPKKKTTKYTFSNNDNVKHR